MSKDKICEVEVTLKDDLSCLLGDDQVIKRRKPRVKHPWLITLLFIPLFMGFFWPGVSDIKIYPTDRELVTLAISKGILSEYNLKDAQWLNEQVESGFLFFVWLVMKRADKITLVDAMKADYADAGVVISKDSAFYVKELNWSVSRY